jgi:hypothetical protein
MNNSIRNIVCCLTAAILLVTTSGCTDSEKHHQNVRKHERSPAKVRERANNWIKKLKSFHSDGTTANFAEREKASIKLPTFGIYAIPRLQGIAIYDRFDDDLDATKRSIDILRNHLKADRDNQTIYYISDNREDNSEIYIELRAAAKAALERVSIKGSVHGQRLAREALASHVEDRDD